ncbi:DegT/DnrJ/EryC1/StrS family aminotransferase [Gephyromycinifex aptenodytis]|uniref:DegT/DnrJ/EryC1/StrS family aminotransferase n=1 Tax=Gephyromycinifex aptenodytis TaxID=2716227 RepID=UPI001447ACC7|nr:aminotransferase class I/II-fold pyridoxal phosphate-dependent enzyme [Gephyromycinifex aptenodytis]
MDEPILLSQAHVTQVEEEYVLASLRSGWVAPLGPDVDAFEEEVAARVGGGVAALALSSGTAALHLALLGIGAGPGSCVLVPTMTFVASANAVAYTGAQPVFVDAAADANLDVDLMIEAVDSLQREGQPIAAVMSVDLFGRCCDYERLAPELETRGIPLIEDAAEALGARTVGGAAGSFGRAAGLSFNGNKIMTTSGGGMLLSSDHDLLDRARYLATQARQPVAWYEHTDIGYNYRLSSVLAALGRAQLSRLDSMIARRRAIREQYASVVAEFEGIRILGRGEHDDPSDASDNCWLTCLLLDEGAPASADEVLTALAARKIEARPLWKPMHLQPVFATARSFLTGTSEGLFARGLTLPSGSALTDAQVERVCDTLRAALRREQR